LILNGRNNGFSRILAAHGSPAAGEVSLHPNDWRPRACPKELVLPGSRKAAVLISLLPPLAEPVSFRFRDKRPHAATKACTKSRRRTGSQCPRLGSQPNGRRHLIAQQFSARRLRLIDEPSECLQITVRQGVTGLRNDGF